VILVVLSIIALINLLIFNVLYTFLVFFEVNLTPGSFSIIKQKKYYNFTHICFGCYIEVIITCYNLNL